MNSRKENTTLYQNIIVELNDEALANVIGGCGSNSCDQPCQDNSWSGTQDCGSQRGAHGNSHCGHDCGLLGDLLCDIL